MRKKLLLTATLLTAALLLPLSLQAPPARAGAVAATPQARVIVKYRADSALLQAPANAAPNARAHALGQRVGQPLRSGRAITSRSEVVYASGVTSAQLAERLAKESDVEYAVPDVRRHALVAPNDARYYSAPITGQQGGPLVGQWYLRAPTVGAPASINAEAAWDVTVGDPNLVVAVLDTGVRFDHPDLGTAPTGNLLAGYDMIHDAGVGNDGQASGPSANPNRDADASDPGDWITVAEANNVGGEFYGAECTQPDPSSPGAYLGADSSWHGTQTSGLVGALTDNGIGMASVGRSVLVLPVRVLGKCGGYDSDIQAGMLWAAGLPVSGVPTNTAPARVLNLSLGSVGACTAAYADTIRQVTAAGAVIVASAGNDEGHSVNAPANCAGVIAVAALRQIGTKVGFSDIGGEVAISAPGGNCVNVAADQPCLYPILTTTNSGLTTPVSNAAGGSTYTDSFNTSLGTSFSAPLVAGTAALMLSIQPELTPAELLIKLQSTARAFPTTGASAGVAQCTVPTGASGSQIDQDECYCTTATCGAGMLDAGAAVASAAGVQARIAIASGAPKAGAPVTLSAADSLVTAGHVITGYQWGITDSGGIVTAFTGATDGPTVTITPKAGGTFNVTLQAVDSTGVISTTTNSVTVEEAPSSGGGGALNLWWLAGLGLAVMALFAASARRQR